MKLVKMTVKEFVDVLASDAPAPGGGSAAALAGSQGCALGAMVCTLTLGKAKYEEFAALNALSQKKLLGLKDKFLAAMDEDTENFGAMTAVFAMPKGTDEEKAARRAAMEEALKLCTKIPWDMLGYSVEALEVLEGIVGKSNQSAASDIGVGALQLKTALQGAWLNVLINLGGIKDEAFVAEHKKEGAALVAKGEALAEKIYSEILHSL